MSPGPVKNTLAALLRNNAETIPHNTAIVYRELHYTFAEHYQRALKLADALAGLGCRPGDRVAVLAKNCVQYLEIYSACEIAAYIIVPVNFRLSVQEIVYVCENTRPLVCFHTPGYEPAIEQVMQGKSVGHLVCIDEENREHDQYQPFLQAGQAIAPAYVPGAEDAACIIHTSGTTGRPKGAVLGQAALYGIAETISVDAAISGLDYGLVMQPLFHVGAKFLQLAHHVRGASIYLAPGFDPASVWQLLVRESITTMQLVPTMLDMLLDEYVEGNYPQTRLSTIFYSTAPIRENLLRRGLAVFGPVFVQQYGSTEGGQVSSLARQYHISHGSEAEQRWLRSAGKVNPGIELRIVDGEGNTLPTGQPGEIIVRHANIMQGYWQDEEATAATVIDGFLHLGDIGYLDKDGFLYIVDRKKDMIISGGENIYPREVEAVLVQHPAVREAAVIGVPDDRWGEAVLAVVVLHEGRSASEAELIAHCKAHMASYKKPRSVSFVKTLPRIATGKVDKLTLRKSYWQDRDSAVV